MLPGESLLTVPAGFMSVLSITTSPLSFLLSPHSSFTLCLFLTYTVCLSRADLKPLSLFFCLAPKYSKRSNPNASKCHEWKRTLLLLLLSHTPKHTNSLSLLPASLSLCGLVRQLCSVGRVSESDLTSAVLLLSWLVCLTLVASGCESYVKYGAVTFFPSSADHETRLGCVCVSECVWRRVLCVHREEIVTDCRLNYSTLLYLMVNKTLQCQTITSQYFCCCWYIWGSF